MTIAMPSAAGSYFVGTKITPVGADSTAANDWISVRVTVTTPPANSYSLSSTGIYNTARAGGTGGSEYSIACPAGSVATGMSGAAGSYYDWASILNVRLECAQLLSSGSLGTTVTTVQAGQFPGGTAFTGICGGGRLLVGAAGHTSGNEPPLVADLSGSCASLATVMSGGGTELSIGPWIGTGVNYNTPFAVTCSPGYVVTGLQGSAGDILDSIGFQCTKVVVSSVIY
jgi:hypothetical protein